MAFLVRAFPLRGSKSELDAFVSALKGPRQAEASAFYRAHDIEHESWHLQETGQGSWVIVVSLARDPAEAAPRYAAATDSFASWFKGQVQTLTGVDPGADPLGPPTHEVYHWSENAQLAGMFTSFVPA
ncbi:MAG: hypothetical protein ACXW2L_19265 [Burkholderiales bacterium]|jgi:hypothetical protein